MNEDLFFAWLDGELDARAAAEVEARVAADPELQRRAEAHRTLASRLRNTFDPIAKAPPPEALVAAARSRPAEVFDFGAERERRRQGRPISVAAQWAAMAATLAIGIVTGTMISSSPGGPIVREDGRLVASAGLEQALYTRLASVPAEDGPHIGLTFRDGSGSLCRSFTDQGSSGLACREGGDWRIRGLFQAAHGQPGEFRMAAGQDRRLAELIDSTIDGEPLDAAQERAAREKGWR